MMVPPTERYFNKSFQFIIFVYREDPPSIGELCDLLVLSDREDFGSFKVRV